MDIKQNIPAGTAPGANEADQLTNKGQATGALFSLSSILVRTMNKDMEALQNGGSLPTPVFSQEPAEEKPFFTPLQASLVTSPKITLSPAENKVSVPPPDLPIPKITPAPAPRQFTPSGPPKPDTTAPIAPPAKPKIIKQPVPTSQPPRPDRASTLSKIEKPQDISVPAPSGRPLSKFALFGSIFLIILVGFCGWFLWNSFGPFGQTPSPTPSQTIEPIEPDSLFYIKATDAKKIIDLGDEGTNKEQILSLVKSSFEEANLSSGDIVRILFKAGAAKFIDLKIVLDELEIKIDDLGIMTDCTTADCLENSKQRLTDYLLPDYTFFAYAQPVNGLQAESSPYARTEPRAGLVIVIKEGQVESSKKILKENEKILPDTLKSLFLEKNVAVPPKPVFLNNVFQKIAIRYINFPDSKLSIDYGFWNNKLIIATSKESMYAIIERLNLEE